MTTKERLYTPQEAITYIAGASAQKHHKQTTKQLPKTNHPLSIDDLVEIAADVGVDKNQLETYINSRELTNKQAKETWKQLHIKPSREQQTKLAQHYINTLHEQLAQTYPESNFIQKDETNNYGVEKTIYERKPQKKLLGLINNDQEIANIEMSWRTTPNITIHDERFLIACKQTIQELQEEFSNYLEKPKIVSYTTIPGLK